MMGTQEYDDDDDEIIDGVEIITATADGQQRTGSWSRTSASTRRALESWDKTVDKAQHFQLIVHYNPVCTVKQLI